MWQEFLKGIWRENPVLTLLLGLCPALAVSTAVTNAVGMAAAATFVLVGSNLIISLFGRFFPSKIRIPCFIVVIASFVTMVDMVMEAFQPDLHAALGIFIPLIVVNCIILGRAEAFASKQKPLVSVLDGVGMGLGFGLALLIVASIREFFGSGKLLGIPVTSYFSTGEHAVVEPMGALILPPGAFIVLGLILAARQAARDRAAARNAGS
jgi:electron transport complex protein RnfE